MSKVIIKKSDKYTDRAKQRLEDFLYERTKVFLDVEKDLILAPEDIRNEFKDITRELSRPMVRLSKLVDRL